MQNLAVTLEVSNPTGNVVSAPFLKPAPRIADLNGKRIGLLWNFKKHGDLVLKRIAEALGERFKSLEFIKLPSGAKLPWGAYPDEKTIAEIAKNQGCDAIIGTIGD